jgi:hypothetical protein
MVADALIPPAGRKVRCGKCTHQWHVTLPKPAEPEKEYVPAPEITALTAGMHVPVVVKRNIPVKPFKIAVPVLALVWVVLAFITYFHGGMKAPVLSGIYSAFGITSTDGLLFADLHMDREQDGSKTRFILSGSIVNHAAEARTVPTVRVMLKDKAGKQVWTREYPVNVALKAGEVYPFRIANVETSFAGNVTNIVLDMGHSLQLMMR